MMSNQQRSRNITTDTAVQSVFVMLQHFHPELHRFMQLLEDKRSKKTDLMFLTRNESKICSFFRLL